MMHHRAGEATPELEYLCAGVGYGRPSVSRRYSAFRALAEENATASPDVVDHVNHAWLCACGHICSGDSRTVFGMHERAFRYCFRYSVPGLLGRAQPPCLARCVLRLFLA